MGAGDWTERMLGVRKTGVIQGLMLSFWTNSDFTHCITVLASACEFIMPC